MWVSCLVLAFFGAVTPYLLIAWGELYITSSAAAVLNATSPLFSALFGHWLALWGQEERLTAVRGARLLLGLVDVAILVGGSEGAQAQGEGSLLELLGYGAVLAASASYGIAGLYARIRFAGMPPIVPAIAQNLGAMMLMLPPAVVLARPAALPSLPAIGSVLALGLGGTAVAYLIYYGLIAQVGATRTLSVTYLLPVPTLLYGRCSWAGL